MNPADNSHHIDRSDLKLPLPPVATLNIHLLVAIQPKPMKLSQRQSGLLDLIAKWSPKWNDWINLEMSSYLSFLRVLQVSHKSIYYGRLIVNFYLESDSFVNKSLNKV